MTWHNWMDFIDFRSEMTTVIRHLIFDHYAEATAKQQRKKRLNFSHCFLFLTLFARRN